MEILDHDKKNLIELLHNIIRLSEYYANSNDSSDKSFEQPIFFTKPKRIEWKNYGLNKNPKFEWVISCNDIALNDTDIIWYNDYILQHDKPLLFHHPLDWQLIAMSNGEITPENKIYVNVNKDSELFGFYSYLPGSDDREAFNQYILATNNDQFKLIWNVLGCYKWDEKKPEHDGRDIPLKIINNLNAKNKCLLDDYYTCSDEECLEKKRKICASLEIPMETGIQITIRECGTCYWVMIVTDEKIIVGGDLFYDRLQDKFVTKGKRQKFPKWEDSFDKITKALNLDLS